MTPGRQIDRSTLDARGMDATVVDDERVADPQPAAVVAPEVEVPAAVGRDVDLAGQSNPEVVPAFAGPDTGDIDLDVALMTAAVAETTGMHRTTVASSQGSVGIASPFQTLNRRYP